jgi:protein tyrosine phosphatase
MLPQRRKGKQAWMGEAGPSGNDMPRTTSVSSTFRMNPLAADLAHLAEREPGEALPPRVQTMRRMESLLDREPAIQLLNTNPRVSGVYEIDDDVLPRVSSSSVATPTHAGTAGQASPSGSSLPGQGSSSSLVAGRRRSYVTDVNAGTTGLLEYNTCVPMARLREHVEMLRSTDRMRAEYQAAIKSATVGSKAFARRANNTSRNRYSDIAPYDHNRVVLRGDTGGNDFINASHLDGFRVDNEYIAAQGPLPHTSEHFWKMVWDRSCHQIAMITGIVEGGKTKCHKYFPDANGDQEYNEIGIHCNDEKHDDNFGVVRTLLLCNNLTGEEREIKHYHFDRWPDHGVPDSTEAFLAFWMHVRGERQFPFNTGPLVTHCSAGVGRTGVFVLCDIAIDCILATKCIDMRHILTQLREQRDITVQTADQYAFCYDVLVSVCDALLGQADFDARALLAVLAARQVELVPPADVPEEERAQRGIYIDVVQARAELDNISTMSSISSLSHNTGARSPHTVPDTRGGSVTPTNAGAGLTAIAIGPDGSHPGDDDEGDQSEEAKQRRAIGHVNWTGPAGYMGPERSAQPRDFVPGMVAELEHARGSSFKPAVPSPGRSAVSAAVAAAESQRLHADGPATPTAPRTPRIEHRLPTYDESLLAGDGDADQEFIAMLMSRRLPVIPGPTASSTDGQQLTQQLVASPPPMSPTYDAEMTEETRL